LGDLGEESVRKLRGRRLQVECLERSLPGRTRERSLVGAVQPGPPVERAELGGERRRRHCPRAVAARSTGQPESARQASWSKSRTVAEWERPITRRRNSIVSGPRSARVTSAAESEASNSPRLSDSATASAPARFAVRSRSNVCTLHMFPFPTRYETTPERRW